MRNAGGQLADSFQLLGLAKLAFECATLGNVFFDGQEMGDRPVRVHDGRQDGRFPVKVAIFLSVAKFAPPLLSSQDGCPERFVHVRRRVAGIEDARVLTPHFFEGVARAFSKLPIRITNIAVRIGDHDGNRALLDGGGELAQSVFVAPALGHVAEGPDAAVVLALGARYREKNSGRGSSRSSVRTRRGWFRCGWLISIHMPARVRRFLMAPGHVRANRKRRRDWRATRRGLRRSR